MRQSWIWLAGILLLMLAVFAQALSFGFLSWDDHYFVVNNKILTLPFFEAVHASFTSFFASDYLPLTLMSLWLDSAVAGGPDAAFSHAVNVVLHAVNVCLLWVWLGPVINEAWRRAIVVALFAMHPLQVESVVWVSERKGLLAACFALLAMLCAQRMESRAVFRIAYPFLLLLSLLSKASNAFLPFVLVAYDRWIGEKTWRQALLRHLPAMFVAAAVVLVRLSAYNSMHRETEAAYWDLERLLYLPLTIVSALGFYVRKFFFPFALSPVYPTFALDLNAAWNIAAALAFAGLCWWVWRPDRKVCFFLAAYFFFLLPVLQIVPRLSFVNDRYAYMAVICLGGIWALALRNINRVTAVAGTAAVVAVASVSFVQSRHWSSDLALWTRATELQPWSGLSHLNLGLAYETGGDLGKALSAYEKAAELGIEVRAQALSNIAAIHTNQSYPQPFDFNKAEVYMGRAIASSLGKSEEPALRYNLARLKHMSGKTAEAKSICADIKSKLDSNGKFQKLAEYVDACLKW